MQLGSFLIVGVDGNAYMACSMSISSGQYGDSQDEWLRLQLINGNTQALACASRHSRDRLLEIRAYIVDRLKAGDLIIDLRDKYAEGDLKDGCNVALATSARGVVALELEYS